MNESKETLTQDNINELQTQIISSDILSLFWNKNKIGCAYMDSELYLKVGEFDIVNDEIQVIEMIIRYIIPKTVVVSIKIPEKIIKDINKLGNNYNIEIVYLKPIYFSRGFGKENFWNILKNADKGEFLINTEKECLIRALGGLVYHKSKTELLNLDNIVVSGIESISLDGILDVDKQSYESLNILSFDKHPGFASTIKDGVCLFTFCDFTCTKMGRKILKGYFLQPSTKLLTIQERQDIIEYFSNPSRFDLLEEIRKLLKQIGEIDKIMIKLNSGIISIPYNYIDLLVKGFKAISVLANTVKHIQFSIFSELLSISPIFIRIVSLIEIIVDLNASKKANHVIPKDNIDDSLDKSRYEYSRLPEKMTQTASEEALELPSTIENYINVINCAWFPQIGFVLSMTVKSDLMMTKDQIAKEILSVCPELTFSLALNENLLFRSKRTMKLDENYGSLYYEIIDLESCIVKELVNQIVEFRFEISKALSLISRIDAIMSLSVAAIEYEWKRPNIVSETIIYIKQGWYPMFYESLPIPNDFSLGCDELGIPNNTRISLITGSNGSGKTKIIQMVGIISFLAHIGSFVPANLCKIGIMDKIFTRIMFQEAVYLGKSGFMGELQQLSHAIQNCTPKSLLLIDEFGKGTHPKDGYSLFTSVLRYFINQGPNTCPRSCHVTHFLLKDQDLFLNEPNENEALLRRDSMKIMFKDNDQNVPELQDSETSNIIPMFKLEMNSVQNQTYGIECAKLAGFGSDIIERSRQLKTYFETGSEIQPLLDLKQQIKIIRVQRRIKNRK